MEACSFDGENIIFNPPAGMDAETCKPLSAARTKLPDGTPVVISCWKATAEELAEINRTARVWLVVWGNAMYPSCLCGIRPAEPG